MKLRTLGLTVLGTLGLTLTTGCQKESAPPPAPATPAPAAPATPAPAPPAIKAQHLPEDVPVPQEAEAPKGGGIIQGVVTFKGTPPPPNPIEPGTDPNCDGMDLVDQPANLRLSLLQGCRSRHLGLRDRSLTPSRRTATRAQTAARGALWRSPRRRSTVRVTRTLLKTKKAMCSKFVKAGRVRARKREIAAS